jgi:hypothetical protein
MVVVGGEETEGEEEGEEEGDGDGEGEQDGEQGEEWMSEQEDHEWESSENLSLTSAAAVAIASLSARDSAAQAASRLSAIFDEFEAHPTLVPASRPASAARPTSARTSALLGPLKPFPRIQLDFEVAGMLRGAEAACAEFELVHVFEHFTKFEILPAPIAVLVVDFLGGAWGEQELIRQTRESSAAVTLQRVWRRFSLVLQAQTELVVRQWIDVYEDWVEGGEADGEEGDAEGDEEGGEEGRAEGERASCEGEQEGPREEEQPGLEQVPIRVQDEDESEDDGEYCEADVERWVQDDLWRRRLIFRSKCLRWRRARAAYVHERMHGLMAAKLLLTMDSVLSEAEWARRFEQEAGRPCFHPMLTREDLKQLISRHTGSEVVQSVSSGTNPVSGLSVGC